MAARTISAAGGYWGATTTWTGGVVPLAADGVVATAGSGNISIRDNAGAALATAVCASFNLTGYTKTVDFPATSKLGVTGNVTLVGSFTGTGELSLANGVGSISATGITFPGAVTFGGMSTKTLSTPLIVTGLVTLQPTAPLTIAGSSTNKLVCNGGLHHAGAGSYVTATAYIEIPGGYWSGTNATAGYLNATLLTITGSVGLSTNIGFRGTLAQSGSGGFTGENPITIGAATTINFNGVEAGPYSFTFGAAVTLTIGSGLVLRGAFATGAYAITLNSTTLTVPGGLTISTGGSLAGTTDITMTGGTWSAGDRWGTVSNSLELAGNVTLGACVSYKTGTLEHTSGNITTTGSTLYVMGSFTLGENGITWEKIYFPVSASPVLQASLACGALELAPSVSVGFSGSYNVTADDLTVNHGGTLTAAAGTVWTVADELNVIGGMETGTPQPASIISSAAFTLTHTGGADHQNVFMAVLTYVSATNPVIAFRSAVTNCVNVIAADERDIGGPATLTLV